MTYTHLAVQDVANAAVTDHVSVTYAHPTTAGHLLVATVFASGASVTGIAIADWVTVTELIFNGPLAHNRVAILVKKAVGDETAIEASATGASAMSMQLREFGGVTLDEEIEHYLDKQAFGNAVHPATALNLGTIEPRDAGELIVAALGFRPVSPSSAWAIDSGFTLGHADNVLVDGFCVTAGTAPLSPTVSWAGPSFAGGVLFSISPTRLVRPDAEFRFGKPRSAWCFGAPERT